MLDFSASFFFNDPAPTEIYTLSLHDALPISVRVDALLGYDGPRHRGEREQEEQDQDRKSTRLNSSHPSISYAVFCLKKKKRRDARPGVGGRPRTTVAGARTRVGTGSARTAEV